MVLNKYIIQREVDATILSGKYTEGLGKVMLLFADVSVYKKGLNYRYNEFEVDFIIKPKIVDMLLLKVFRYNKKYSSAYTFFSLITSTAIADAIRDIRRDKHGESEGVFYIEDVKSLVAELLVEDCMYDANSVWLDGNIIRLK